MRLASGLLASCATALLVGSCAAPQNPAPSDGDAKVSAPNHYAGYSEKTYDGYQRSSFYVPMRDGTKLAVDLFRPTRNGVVASEKLPVVWMHTPYNRRDYRTGPTAEVYPGFALKLAPYGYNVAVVDFRGTYASYGRNVAYNRGEWVEPAKWDAYDVTEWLAKQPWSSGKIGMWGCSATGGSQMQALSVMPPHLNAVIPMSAEFDVYAFTTLGGVSGPRPISTPGATGGKEAIAARDKVAAAVDGPGGASALAEAVATHEDNIETVGVVPFRDSKSSTMGAQWWLTSSFSSYFEAVRQKAHIGVMSVANWDEAGTKHGPFFTFNNLNPHNAKLLVGPGTHCAWSYAQEQTGFDLVTEELRFYDFWLKGKANNVMSEPAVTYYTYNAPKGSEYRQSETWPLKTEKRTNFYLGAGGALGETKPATAAKDSVAISAPSKTSTTILIEAPAGGKAFETAPLAADLEVTGHPVMDLWIETAANDTDVTARIDDVAPDGTTRSYQMIGQLRASHRTLAKAPYNNLGLPWMTHREADAKPLPANAPTELKFALLPMSYIFKAGHKVRVTLTFVDPQRRSEGISPVTVLSGPATPSAIVLPVIPPK
ncbi:MAG: CocE/NonD family hydrolase [Alphaproteobacteria bacterium]